MLLIREEINECGVIEWRQIYQIEPKYRNLDDLVASKDHFVIISCLYSDFPHETQGTCGQYTRHAMIYEIRNKIFSKRNKSKQYTTLLEDDPLCF